MRPGDKSEVQVNRPANITSISLRWVGAVVWPAEISPESSMIPSHRNVLRSVRTSYAALNDKGGLD